MPLLADNRLRDAALHYASLGWLVLPLHHPDDHRCCSCGHPNCSKPAKHPRTRHGVRNATTNTSAIRTWWDRWPAANIGIATGDLIVIDIDGPEGAHALTQLERIHGPLPLTLAAATGRGTHVYFTYRDGDIGNSAGRLGPGLDVRGKGGHVVAPPSQHAHGSHYSWTARCPPARLPGWIAANLTRSASASPQVGPPPRNGDLHDRYVRAAMHAEADRVAEARPGARNNTLNRAAFRVAQLTGDDPAALHELEQHLLVAAQVAGLDAHEARATIASGLTAGRQHPRG